jgi:hypothetical protein
MTFGIFAKNSKETTTYLKKETVQEVQLFNEYKFCQVTFFLGGGGGDFIFALKPKKVKRRKKIREKFSRCTLKRSQAANDIGERETVVVKLWQRPHKNKAAAGLLELEQLGHGGPHDVLLHVKRHFLRIRDTFGTDPDPRIILAFDQWIQIWLCIMLFSSLTFKTPTRWPTGRPPASKGSFCGSVRFWYGSGSAPLTNGSGSVPLTNDSGSGSYRTIFVIDLQDSNKKIFFS